MKKYQLDWRDIQNQWAKKVAEAEALQARPANDACLATTFVMLIITIIAYVIYV